MGKKIVFELKNKAGVKDLPLQLALFNEADKQIIDFSKFSSADDFGFKRALDEVLLIMEVRKAKLTQLVFELNNGKEE